MPRGSRILKFVLAGNGGIGKTTLAKVFGIGANDGSIIIILKLDLNNPKME